MPQSDLQPLGVGGTQLGLQQGSREGEGREGTPVRSAARGGG